VPVTQNCLKKKGNISKGQKSQLKWLPLITSETVEPTDVDNNELQPTE
jgi:hypothetical protein